MPRKKRGERDKGDGFCFNGGGGSAKESQVASSGDGSISPAKGKGYGGVLSPHAFFPLSNLPRRPAIPWPVPIDLVDFWIGLLSC